MRCLVVSLLCVGLAGSGCSLLNRGGTPGEPTVRESDSGESVTPTAVADPGSVLVDTFTLSPFGKTLLDEAMRATIDQAVARLVDRELYFEIEGHTDSSGSEAINERVALK